MNEVTIEQKLRVLNDHIKGSAIPIKVVPLARKLGINVFEVAWPDNVSGKIQRDEERGGDSGFAIYLNKAHPNTRKRFTLAHEIAHYILHEYEIGDGIFDDALYRSGLSDKVEIEANNLAADILMPRTELENRISDGVDVPSLACQFEVSEQAMSIRLGKSFGLQT